MTGKVNEKDLESVVGGNGGGFSGSWVYGTVHDVIHYDSASCLPLLNAPDGDVMYTASGRPMGWQNGENAYVQPSSRTGRWIKADWNGTIGWTNANNIWY